MSQKPINQATVPENFATVFAAACASTAQYAEQRLGMSPRRTRKLISVGRTLQDLPETDQACRELEQEVKQGQKGQLPRAGNRWGLPRVRFAVKASLDVVTYELWEQAKLKLRDETGESIGDGELMRVLAEMLLGSDADGLPKGRKKTKHSLSLYQVVIQMSGAEAAVQTEAGPVALEGGEEILAVDERIHEPTSPAMREAILARDGHRCHALVHEGLLTVSGECPQGLIFKATGKLLGKVEVAARMGSVGGNRRAGSRSAAVRVCGKSGPRGPEDEAGDAPGNTPGETPGETPGDAAAGSAAKQAQPLGFHGAPEQSETFEIPAVVDAKWWREHEHLFLWNRKGTSVRLVKRRGRRCNGPSGQGE